MKNILPKKHEIFSHEKFPTVNFSQTRVITIYQLPQVYTYFEPGKTNAFQLLIKHHVHNTLL